MNELFQEELIEAAKAKHNYGVLDDADESSTSFNASCGDTISVQIKYGPGKETIENLKWTGNGCIISQAGMSLLSDVVIGEGVEKVSALTLDDMLDLMQLKNITPGRTKCLVLGLTTLQQALGSNNQR